MYLFFAGSETFTDLLKKRGVNMLMSYFHIPSTFRKNSKIKQSLGLDSNQKLFIDSGAFSAFTLFEETNIDEYIEWCKNTDADYYSVLDDIRSAEKTLENQKYMESKGVKPIPCFHFGEDWKYLDYYCEHYDFVAIGGMVPIARNRLDKWLSRLFVKYPNKKFHGFGLTTNWLVEKFPWYSVDSSSWISGGKTKTLFDIELGTARVDDALRSGKWLKKIIDRGFVLADFKDDKNYLQRLDFNVISYLEMQNKHEMLEYKHKCESLERWC